MAKLAVPARQGLGEHHLFSAPDKYQPCGKHGQGKFQRQKQRKPTQHRRHDAEQQGGELVAAIKLIQCSAPMYRAQESNDDGGVGGDALQGPFTADVQPGQQCQTIKGDQPAVGKPASATDVVVGMRAQGGHP